MGGLARGLECVGIASAVGVRVMGLLGLALHFTAKRINMGARIGSKSNETRSNPHDRIRREGT
jgi:hypothetical protein